MEVVSSEDTPRPFHKRFDIDVGADEARVRFMNRVSNLVFGLFMSRNFSIDDRQELRNVAASALGELYASKHPIEYYIKRDFRNLLQVLETMYQHLEGTADQVQLDDFIHSIMRYSETDIGISWQPPIFVRTGAPLLDENLVNEPLRWLSEPKYKSVHDPFSKGLSHYLEATNKPERLADVVTDMYEAVEALARIVTGRDKDLSGNREAFIKAVKLSDHYRQLLRNYVEYGSEFRHAVRLGKPRPPLTEPEVEAFVYLTGLFIHLAIRQN